MRSVQLTALLVTLGLGISHPALADLFGLTTSAQIISPVLCSDSGTATASCSGSALAIGETLPLVKVDGSATAQASFGTLHAHINLNLSGRSLLGRYSLLPHFMTHWKSWGILDRDLFSSTYRRTCFALCIIESFFVLNDETEYAGSLPLCRWRSRFCVHEYSVPIHRRYTIPTIPQRSFTSRLI